MKKKKARALKEQTEIMHFLVQISLLLKENVLARPEVKEFFSRSARQIHQATRATFGVSRAKKKTTPPGAGLAMRRNRKIST